MKILGLGVILVLLLVTPIFAAQEDNTFSVGESFMIKNRNISVVQIDSKDDKIVVCVNNVKDIVSKEKTVNGVFIDIRSVDSDSVKLSMSYKCNEAACFCEGLECTNQLCFPKEESEDEDVVELVTTPTSNAVKEINIVKSEPTQNAKSSGAGFIYFTILLVILIIVLMIIFRKKN